MDGWIEFVSVDRGLASKGIIISKKVLASAYQVRCGGVEV